MTTIQQWHYGHSATKGTEGFWVAPNGQDFEATADADMLLSAVFNSHQIIQTGSALIPSSPITLNVAYEPIVYLFSEVVRTDLNPTPPNRICIQPQPSYTGATDRGVSEDCFATLAADNSTMTITGGLTAAGFFIFRGGL